MTRRNDPNKLSGYRTTVTRDADGVTRVTYAATCIVEFTDNTVTLNSGGYASATTKKKMNQAARQFALGFSVYQKARKWYAVTDGLTYRFVDGLSFPIAKAA